MSITLADLNYFCTAVFDCVLLQIHFWSKWCKNYQNQLRFAKSYWLPHF